MTAELARTSFVRGGEKIVVGRSSKVTTGVLSLELDARARLSHYHATTLLWPMEIHRQRNGQRQRGWIVLRDEELFGVRRSGWSKRGGHSQSFLSFVYQNASLFSRIEVLHMHGGRLKPHPSFTSQRFTTTLSAARLALPSLPTTPHLAHGCQRPNVSVVSVLPGGETPPNFPSSSAIWRARMGRAQFHRGVGIANLDAPALGSGVVDEERSAVLGSSEPPKTRSVIAPSTMPAKSRLTLEGAAGGIMVAEDASGRAWWSSLL
jgi:hypothetical protein